MTSTCHDMEKFFELNFHFFTVQQAQTLVLKCFLPFSQGNEASDNVRKVENNGKIYFFM